MKRSYRAKRDNGLRVVLATNNRGKLRELEALFAPLGIELVGLAALGIASPEESATTFVENALIKARHAALSSRLPAIADDSGLVVPALRGAPGVRSARYAGPKADDAANNAQLIHALRDVADRRAYFYCALAFLRSADDPAPLLATCAWHGEIVDEPRGQNGFGYDPHFYLRDLSKTSAELAPLDKDALSHRGQAARLLARALGSAFEVA